MLSDRQAFKAAFLHRCVDAGLTLPEIYQTIKQANALLDAGGSAAKSVIGKTMDLGGQALSALASKGLPLALAAPPVIGGLAGFTASRLTDVDDTDVSEMKRRELIAEYRRSLDRMIRSQRSRELRNKHTRSGRRLT